MSSTNTASNRNELIPRMADPFIIQFPEFRQIPLSQGYYAIVDAENYEWLMQWKWTALICRGIVYAKRSSVYKKRNTPILMHRQIMGTPKNMKTDHCNGNGLINTHDNLRVCTHAQNMRNQYIRNGLSSKYKGVSWDKRYEKWQAYITINRKKRHLGYFISELEAAYAYNAAALKYYGEFARLNIIDPIDEAA